MRCWQTTSLAAVLAMAGCATMKNDTTQLVRVTSTPPGAEVFLDGRSRGTTPTWIRLSRRSREPRIRVEKEGRSHHMRLRRGMSPWMLANIPAGVGTGVVGMLALRGCDECGPSVPAGVFASLAPMLVDLITGAAMRFPSEVDVTLVPTRTRRMEVPGHLPEDVRRTLVRAAVPTVGARR